MAELIALRKRRPAEFGTLAALSTSERRTQLAARAETSERTEVLKNRGFEQISSEYRVDDPAEPRPKPPNEFERLGLVGAYVIRAEDSQKLDEARQVLQADYELVPNIPLAIPAPVATDYARLTHDSDGTWPAESRLDDARSSGVAGSEVIVGVLDTGVDADHIELRSKRIGFRYVPLQPNPNRLRDCRGFDTNGHGTHVCGIIAGKNVGVAPEATLLVASVIESETMRTSLERIVVGLNWMLSEFSREENAEKATIVSMSLGFRRAWIEAGDLQAAMRGVQTVLSTLAEDFDVLPVVAIGNDGPGTMRAPGYFSEALSVGAVDFGLDPANFSGGGQSPLGSVEPDIAGYGVDVLSSLERSVFNRSRYARMSGTSMATPYVSGIAALVASANPGLVSYGLRNHLLSNAQALQHPADRVGAGLARFA